MTIATAFAGGGNTQLTIGSGTIGYIQAGYVLQKLKNGTTFMTYFKVTYKDLNVRVFSGD